MRKATLPYLCDHFAEVWDGVEGSRREMIVTREGHEDLALIPATELRGLRETVRLLASPRNAVRLHAALERSRGGDGVEFESADELAAAVGLPRE